MVHQGPASYPSVSLSTTSGGPPSCLHRRRQDGRVRTLGRMCAPVLVTIVFSHRGAVRQITPCRSIAGGALPRCVTYRGPLSVPISTWSIAFKNTCFQPFPRMSTAELREPLCSKHRVSRTFPAA